MAHIGMSSALRGCIKGQATAVLTRDDFGVDDALASARMSADELASLQAVADAEDIGPYYGGDPAMPEVWAQLETSYTQSPFPSLAEVPVSSGFGYRWGSFHGGWLERKKLPSAGTISAAAATLGGLAIGLGLLAAARRRQRE